MSGYAIVKLSDSDKAAIQKANDHIEEKLSSSVLGKIVREFTSVKDKKFLWLKVGTVNTKDETGIRESFNDEFVYVQTIGELFNDNSCWLTSITRVGSCAVRLGDLTSVEADSYMLDPDMANALAVVIEKFGE